MKHKLTLYYRIISMFAIMGMLAACTDSNTEPWIGGDYFPMQPGATWQYVYESNCDTQPCDSYITNWFTFTAEDSVFDGKRYTVLRNTQDISAIVRKEGTRYYRWDMYTNREYLFLDTALPEGSSWIESEDQYWKTEYTAGKPLPWLMVKKKRYSDIVVVKRTNTYADDDYSFRVEETKYYARGIGEVYTEQEWPVVSYVHDVKLSLLSHEPH